MNHQDTSTETPSHNTMLPISRTASKETMAKYLLGVSASTQNAAAYPIVDAIRMRRTPRPSKRRPTKGIRKAPPKAPTRKMSDTSRALKSICCASGRSKTEKPWVCPIEVQAKMITAMARIHHP